jgi:16S rRNA (cytosine967-C5)-methyltransferase
MQTHAPYEVFTLVNQAVEAAKRQHATQAQAGFVNACLRRFLRERDALVGATAKDPVAQWNHPRWWIARLQKDHPTRWQDVLRASNTPAPMTLRVNARQQHTPAQYRQTLGDAGISATPIGTHGLVLDRGYPVHELPGFDAGVVSVQDAAAQQAAPLLLTGLQAPPDGQRLQRAGRLRRARRQNSAPAGNSRRRCHRAGRGFAALRTHSPDAGSASACLHAWRWAMRAGPTHGGTASCMMRSCWMRHALRRASCGVTPTCAGCAVNPTLRNSPPFRRGCWRRCGRCSSPAGVCCTAPVRYFAPRATPRYKRLLRTTPTPYCKPSPGHLMPRSGANANPVPDNLEGDHDGFFYALLQKHPAPGHVQAST